ncbi:MAG: glycerophosphodiester phosphodiesterase, partial [Actinobacteria bacterium]|nr:glycerophosphodiester phosphodiesterase [Actinomycetota bacterium]
MASFDLAVRQKADLIELDVQLTRDEVLVVMHDPAVDRTTDGRGLVKDMTLAEVRRLNAAARFPAATGPERVPTLDEVLEWAAGRLPVAIEIKGGPIHYPDIEGRVVGAIRRHRLSDSTVVISFDHVTLLRLKRLSPEIATGVLYACAPVQPSSLAIAAQSDALLPHWADLSEEMVADAHEHGLAISTWAVDGEQELQWVLS